MENLYSLDEALAYLNGDNITPIDALLMETYNESVLFDELLTEANIKESIKSLWERFKAWLQKFKLHFQAAINRLSAFITRKLGSGFIAAAEANKRAIKKIIADPKNVGKFNATKSMIIKDRIDFDKTEKNIDAVEKYLEAYKGLIEGILKDNSIKTLDVNSLTENQDKASKELAKAFRIACSTLGVKRTVDKDNMVFEAKDIIVYRNNTQVTLDELQTDIFNSISTAKYFDERIKRYNKLSREVTSLVNKTESSLSKMFSTYASICNEDKGDENNISFSELNNGIASHIKYINKIYMFFNKVSVALVNACMESVITIAAEISIIKTGLKDYIKED